MRKICLILIGTISLVFVFTISVLYAEDEVSFSYDDNLPPYCWEEKGQMRGIFIDITTEAIEKRLGITVIHKNFPWKRTVIAVKKGKVDGIIRPCSHNDEWAQSCSEVVLSAGQQIFAYANSPKINQLRSLENKHNFSYDANLYKWKALRPFKWVTGRGEAPFEVMAENGFDVYFLGWNSLFRYLAAGRADATIIVRDMGLFRIKQLGLHEQVIMLSASINQVYCIFINTRSPYVKILPELGKVLKQMKAEGVIQGIENKYIQGS